MMDKINDDTGPLLQRTPPLKTALSAGSGFVAGIVFWHMVGFWSFVNDAVLYKRADSGQPAPVRSASVPPKAQSRQSGVAGPLQAAAVNCTIAAIDRHGGGAQAVGCEWAAAVKFQPPRGTPRADYADFGPTPVPVLISGGGIAQPGDAPAISGWAARIESTADAPAGGKGE